MTNQPSYTVITEGDTAIPNAPFTARHFIDGKYADSADGATFSRTSPSHGHVVSIAAKGGEAETNAAITAARRAFDSGVWSERSGKERAEVLHKVADLISARVEEMSVIETLESGKPISQARGEVAGAADLWRFAASLARTMHGDSHNTLGADMLGVVLKEPIGVVSLITPWNFPFWILSQKLPFALAAGCTCVVKPSEMTPSTTAMMADILMEAGLPSGVVNIVLGFGEPVGALMATHPDVDMVSFTGSTRVGKAISAGAAATLKKVALELGGKNPQVIFPNCDIEAAADAVTFGTYFNQGECCNASSRVLVHEDIAEDFTAKVVALSKKVRFGNPMHATTQVGAMITPEHQGKVHDYVEAAKTSGAACALGGAPFTVSGLKGEFYEPTILTNVRPDMAVAREEVFGPVLAVMTFRTLDEAINIVNDATYGLSAGIWCDDIHTCLTFARRARAGTVWTNTWMDGYPELCFGGMRESGQGRENGHYGLEEFLEVKTVAMRIGRTAQPWVTGV